MFPVPQNAQEEKRLQEFGFDGNHRTKQSRYRIPHRLRVHAARLKRSIRAKKPHGKGKRKQ